MCAALKARESGADVLMVDKCGIGWNGQVPIGGGILAYVYPVRCRRLGREGHARQQLLEQSGVDPRFREPHAPVDHGPGRHGADFPQEGRGDRRPRLGPTNVTLFDSPKSLVALKKTAAARGVRMMDKIFVVDLLKNGDQVVGAVALGLVDGRIYVFNAKATIVATGNCGYLHEKTYASVLGEGPAMGYRAGAQVDQRRVQQHVRVGHQDSRQGADGHPLLSVSGERPGREDHGQVLPGTDGGRARGLHLRSPGHPRHVRGGARRAEAPSTST